MERKSNNKRGKEKGADKRVVPTISAVVDRTTLVELLYDPFEKRTALAVCVNGSHRIETDYTTAAGEHLVPYSADNNLIKHGVVLFPSEPEEYGTEAELLAEVRSYIHRYADLSDNFEVVAAHYVLFTWLHERFRELTYLRMQGGFGTGKTRFLLTVGSICRTPIFASGASSVAPLFHMLDRFGGTLLLDEADFRFSDAKADIAKILNNGNVKGFPVLRCESKDGKEFNPRAFQVFGPKLIAMRGHFEDQALESRCLTEVTAEKPLRTDIPINLPEEQRWEAQLLRNKLLMYRFRNFHRFGDCTAVLDTGLEPRLNQVLSPLAAVMDTDEARSALKTLAQQSHEGLASERGDSLEAQMLIILRLLAETAGASGIAVKLVADVFNRSFGKEHPRKVSAKWIGGVIRRRLNLKTEKRHGVFVIPSTEHAKLAVLYARYAITDEDVDALASEPGALPGELVVERNQAGDLGDIGDFVQLPVIR